MHVEEFDINYTFKVCDKCGQKKGFTSNYFSETDILIVCCHECGYCYDMEPKIKSK